MHKPSYLLVIAGPTASGKTSMAIRLAQHFDTVILSADSRQFYRELSIGTAKPTEEERAQATHYFIDSLSIQEDYSVGDYEREALGLLKKLFEKHQLVILTGGSGLFIKAVCEGLDEFPEVPGEIRSEVERLLDTQGLVALQEELRLSDPDYYELVDLHNPSRLIRALAVIRSSGKTFSSFRQQQPKPRFFTPLYTKLEMARDLLYERINLRVDQMMQNGLLNEARTVAPLRHLNALQTVGYQEFFDHFDGFYDLVAAVELVKRNSRRYAKRQLTWLRKQDHWKGFTSDDADGMINWVEEMVS